jgi:DNA-binding IscR family transcriptional regulator
MTTAEFADNYSISEQLMKVTHRLGFAAYVETVRGLLKRPAEIKIGEIVRRIEPDFDLMPCCSASEPFHTRTADLAGPRRKLAALLAMSVPGAVAVVVQTRGKT